jgi:ABC-type multidrug transport system fused ATPase/permease subunit
MLMTLLIIFLLIIFFYDFIFKKKVMLYGERLNTHISRMISGISESMRGFKEIKVLRCEKYFYNLVSFNAAKYSIYSFKNQVVNVASRYMIELGLILFVVMVVLKSVLVNSDIGELIPTLAVFGVAAIRLVPIANSATNSLLHLRHGRNTLNILCSDLKGTDLNDSPPNVVCNNVESEFVSIEAKNLDFSYAKLEVKALTDISLKINSGEVIGFIGRSGSGKTTLVDVMLGILPVAKDNSILYNGSPLADHINELYSHIAYIPQEVFLIDDTLRSNVALGVEKDDIDEDAVRSAVYKSKLDEVVNQLQDGLDTPIGENGIKLSGGQRQRIALARAFYHKRDVLIMDESTSALDNETEEEILKEIREFKGKKTLIVIAHRLTTLRYCDRIYELENGKIINFGSYKEMILDRDRV